MTEDEAKTKVCPAMRYCVNQIGVAQDRDTPVYDQSPCIASACMAWRTRVETVTGYGDFGEPEPRPSVTVGYCGLAGVPA